MKPILFNTEMVKALLDGRKTVTRRLVKPQPQGYFEVNENPLFIYDTEWNQGEIHPSCQVGDILYVMETWKEYAPNKYMYRADGEQKDCGDLWEGINANLGVWRPSIHMPKEASRIFLRVTDVRVEKLQDMQHDAPMEEGIRGYSKDGELYKYAVSDNWWSEYHRKNRKRYYGNWWQDMPKNPTKAFELYWDSTIDMKEHWMDQSWGANPWCFVYNFERISKEEAYRIVEN